MHEIEDTEAADAASELVWPQSYKLILRTKLRLHLMKYLAEDHLLNVFGRTSHNTPKEDHIDGYAQKIVIGAENGSDEVFEAIHASFSNGIPLPCICRRQKSLIRDTMIPKSIQDDIDKAIYREYGQEHLYTHVYEDYYQDVFSSFEEFTSDISKKALTGIINGAEDMYGRIVRSLCYRMPLPPARRHPRAIKGLL